MIVGWPGLVSLDMANGGVNKGGREDVVFVRWHLLFFITCVIVYVIQCGGVH